MNVSLTPELEELVTSKVRSGLYASASEVVHEALRLLSERDARHDANLDEIRSRVRVGLEQYERGESRPVSAGVFEDAERKALAIIESRRKQSST